MISVLIRHARESKSYRSNRLFRRRKHDNPKRRPGLFSVAQSHKLP
jgi:hypothetical protein